MSAYFDSQDDPLLMAIMEELMRRQQGPAGPTPDFSGPGALAGPRPDFSGPGAPPALPPFGRPFDPPGPGAPPEGPDYDEPDIAPPADTAPAPPLPPRPKLPPVPGVPIGGMPTIPSGEVASAPAGPTPPKALGGALALALMRQARPVNLAGSRSRFRSSRGRNRGLRNRPV